MATNKRPKRLTLDDMKPADYSVIDKYTDEDAKKSGYPSLEVMKMEYELTRIAGKWRETKEESLVHQYKGVLYEMIFKGYDVNTLPIQDQLPDALMPELPPQRVQVAIRQVYEQAD
ncbi:MAG: hypothetical protein AAFR81_28185 [Chloroflexota bacterium]